MRFMTTALLVFDALASFSSAASNSSCDTSTDACVDVLDNSHCQITAVDSGNKTAFLECFQGGYSSLAPVTKICQCVGCVGNPIDTFITNNTICT
ncbi:uncharacterized protein LY89DRAFT_474739 [Mollisia scopiformis]|uniref:Uncharacterized protein n=1 Tax=Mollisia scopiformis TaxID=149040 RepID=A0A194XFW3_MOLSC|nr:uncharacterized protein LY89DRAFT_474739 [Mollisia scopiformis]KUJ19031.1 hypothetical protein LY89DRAFT_474739 [Mollisia scopiformis]